MVRLHLSAAPDPPSLDACAHNQPASRAPRFPSKHERAVRPAHFGMGEAQRLVRHAATEPISIPMSSATNRNCSALRLRPRECVVRAGHRVKDVDRRGLTVASPVTPAKTAVGPQAPGSIPGAST
jgi:hypothetical protein